MRKNKNSDGFSLKERSAGRLLRNIVIAGMILLAFTDTVGAFSVRTLCKVSISEEDREAIELGTLPPLKSIAVSVSKENRESTHGEQQTNGGIDKNGLVIATEYFLRSLKLEEGDVVQVAASVGLEPHQNPCWTGSVEFVLPPVGTAKDELPVLHLRRCPHPPKRIRCVVATPDGTRPPKKALTLNLRKAGEREDDDAAPRLQIVAEGVGEIWLPGALHDTALEIYIDQGTLGRWGPKYAVLHNPSLEFVPSELPDDTVEYRLDPISPSVVTVLKGSEDALELLMDKNPTFDLYRYTPPKGFFTGGKPRWHGERLWKGNPKRMGEDGALVERFWSEKSWGWIEHVKFLSGDNRRSYSRNYTKLKRSVFSRKTEDGQIVAEFYAVPEGQYWLQVGHRQLTPQPRIIDVPPEEAGTIRTEIVLTKHEPVERIKVQGRVVNEKGKPVPSPYVRLRWPGSSDHYAETAADGTFSYDMMPVSYNMVPVKEIEVHARKRGYTVVERTVAMKELKKEGEIRIRMHPMPHVKGRVTDEAGHPVRNALVSLLNSREPLLAQGRWEELALKTTDAKGHYDLLAKKGRGCYALVAREPSAKGRATYQEIAVDDNVHTQDLILPSGYPVTIRINAEAPEDSPANVRKGRYGVNVYNKNYPPIAGCGSGEVSKNGRVKLSLAPGTYAAVLFIEELPPKTGAKKRRGPKPVPQYSALPPVTFEVKQNGSTQPVVVRIPADWEKKVIYTGELNSKSLRTLWYSEHCPWWTKGE